MTVGEFGVTADGRYVEGQRPRSMFGPRRSETERRAAYRAGARDPIAADRGWNHDSSTLAANALSFNQMANLYAPVLALQGVPDALREGSLSPIGEAFQESRQGIIDGLDEIEARRPVTALGANVTGGVVTGGALARAAGQVGARVAPSAMSAMRGLANSGRLGQAAVGAGAGAAGGAAWGLGDDTVAESAGWGAAGGAAAPMVARGLGAAANGVRRLFRNPGVTPEQTAARQLAPRLRPDAQAMMNEAASLGSDPPALLDVLRNSGRRRVRAASSAGDEAQELALSYRDGVRSQAPDRAQRIAERMTGRPVNLDALRSAADDNVRAVDNANYPSLMGERLRVTPEMVESLRSPDAQDAIRAARRVAELSGRQDDVASMNSILEAVRTGRVSLLDDMQMSASGLEQIYRSLRDTASGLSANPATRSVGSAMSGVRSQFDAELLTQSPAIRGARAMSQEARSARDALDTGTRALSPSVWPQELAAEVAQMRPSAQLAARQGAQGQLQQQIGQNPTAAIRDMASRPNTAARLGALGAPSNAMAGMARVEARRLAGADFVSPNTGSQTQLRATDLDSLGGIPVTPMGWATKLADFAFRRGQALTDAELTAIVRMGVKPADLAELQRLAARAPDRVPAMIQSLIGAQAVIGVASPESPNR
ncbi:MAG: hypothetical protein ACRC56_11865 [Bosea sp. (in: a-proteobacteria)]